MTSCSCRSSICAFRSETARASSFARVFHSSDSVYRPSVCQITERITLLSGSLFGRNHSASSAETPLTEIHTEKSPDLPLRKSILCLSNAVHLLLSVPNLGQLNCRNRHSNHLTRIHSRSYPRTPLHATPVDISVAEYRTDQDQTSLSAFGHCVGNQASCVCSSLGDRTSPESRTVTVFNRCKFSEFPVHLDQTTLSLMAEVTYAPPGRSP